MFLKKILRQETNVNVCKACTTCVQCFLHVFDGRPGGESAIKYLVESSISL